MEARDADLKKELDATLQTRKELGAEYESELVDSFLEKIGERLDSTVERRVRRELGERQVAVARGARPQDDGEGRRFGERFGFGMFSLALAVPLSAIGAVQAGLPGLIVSWVGVVGVNVVQARGRRPWRSEESRTRDEWS